MFRMLTSAGQYIFRLRKRLEETTRAPVSSRKNHSRDSESKSTLLETDSGES